ncbi:pyrroline-5-carboxylate reductase [Blastopirellula retiformator]|uniref:Pyrroline-5-carboxylate reductase n=1 Tax=Blastopirellula retiformator TaxID=2527970 RepID=A0A5C5V0V3_9BACT|nr:pyrroline-5-carboxylate reductase [Blastopirellula retiformator]TWT31550.1 Pyrroline-5-carboxylate reductase [Blastopirellula retiformator]
MSKIGFLGAGQMAQALASGFVRADLVHPADIVAVDPFPAAQTSFASLVPGAAVSDKAASLATEVDVIFLAVKPQMMQGAIAGLGKIGGDVLLVSIAAGTSLAKLTEWTRTDRIIRVMPNTPCLIGESASAVCTGSGATAEDAALIEQLMSAVGVVRKVDEKLMDAVTGLSGSGPAYVYVMIEALADAGVRVGLPRDAALQLAAQTVRGAAGMVLETGDHPGVLKDRVASPGGTTIAGLQALEAGRFRAAAYDAVVAATARSQELGAE